MSDEIRNDAAVDTGVAAAAAADPLADLAAAAPSLSFGAPEPSRNLRKRSSLPKSSKWWMPLSNRSTSPIRRPS